MVTGPGIHCEDECSPEVEGPVTLTAEANPGYLFKGWAKCEGQLLPINQNQALFALIGTIYGGDGKVTFALPDVHLAAPEWTTVSVPAIAPRGQAMFATEPLHDGAHQWSLVRLTGTPAKKK